MSFFRRTIPAVLSALILTSAAMAAGRGIDVAALVIPEPRQVEYAEGYFPFTPETPVVLDPAVRARGRIAAVVLRERLVELLGSSPEIEVGAERAGVIYLAARPDFPGIPPEGYRLSIAPYGIRILGADPAGLYYGAVTLVQLLNRRGPGEVELPCLEITDWPDLPLRAVHYDLKHHQDRFDSLKGIIDRLGFHKLNGLVLELEDKFAYPSHPEIGAPGALTPDRLRALWNYADERHVELIPLVQGLGHVSYILKHPRFAPLREAEDSPWQFCPYKPGSIGLLTDLYQDILDTLPGGRYFHIGGDESYELGRCPVCSDIMEATGVGMVYLDWMLPVVDYLADRGRRVLVWDDMILQFGDETLRRLPRDMIYCRWNYDTRQVEKARLLELGFPVLVCPATQCVTPLFPDYEKRLQNIAYFIPAGRRSGAMGSLTTAWDDSGCHQETFWYGFACAAEYSWTGESPPLDRFREKFMRHFYGPDAANMLLVYDVLGQTGDLWTILRGGPFWYGERRADAGGPIPLPQLPSDSLTVSDDWRGRFGSNVLLARERSELLNLVAGVLDEAVSRGGAQTYNLEVLRSVARYAAYSAWAVTTLGRIDGLYRDARARDEEGDFAAAAASLREALELAGRLETEGRFAFNELVSVWEKSRLPKGMAADGREYLHMTDLAGHLANATPDMTYLRLVEESWDLAGYTARLEKLVGSYELRRGQ